MTLVPRERVYLKTGRGRNLRLNSGVNVHVHIILDTKCPMFLHLSLKTYQLASADMEQHSTNLLEYHMIRRRVHSWNVAADKISLRDHLHQVFLFFQRLLTCDAIFRRVPFSPCSRSSLAPSSSTYPPLCGAFPSPPFSSRAVSTPEGPLPHPPPIPHPPTPTPVTGCFGSSLVCLPCL